MDRYADPSPRRTDKYASKGPLIRADPADTYRDRVPVQLAAGLQDPAARTEIEIASNYRRKLQRNPPERFAKKGSPAGELFCRRRCVTQLGTKKQPDLLGRPINAVTWNSFGS